MWTCIEDRFPCGVYTPFKDTINLGTDYKQVVMRNMVKGP